MSGPAIVFMIVVCTFVWGGFSVSLVRAVRSESRKSGSD